MCRPPDEGAVVEIGLICLNGLVSMDLDWVQVRWNNGQRRGDGCSGAMCVKEHLIGLSGV